LDKKASCVSGAFFDCWRNRSLHCLTGVDVVGYIHSSGIVLLELRSGFGNEGRIGRQGKGRLVEVIFFRNYLL